MLPVVMQIMSFNFIQVNSQSGFVVLFSFKLDLSQLILPV